MMVMVDRSTPKSDFSKYPAKYVTVYSVLYENVGPVESKVFQRVR